METVELKVNDTVWGPNRNCLGIITEIQEAYFPDCANLAIVVDTTRQFYLGKYCLDKLTKYND